MFDSPRDGTRLIKRIVAIGGDVVTLDDGQLTINGKPLGDEQLEHFGGREALLNLDDGGGPDLHEYKIPSGMVLAIGDHRGNSFDGRFFGPISERELFGRAVAHLLPPRRRLRLEAALASHGRFCDRACKRTASTRLRKVIGCSLVRGAYRRAARALRHVGDDHTEARAA